MQIVKVGPKADFETEIKENITTLNYENWFMKTKYDRMDLKVKEKMKPKFEAKLTLRDALKSIYDSSVRMNSNELSLQSLKLQQDTRQKLNNLKDQQEELTNSETKNKLSAA